MSLIKAKRKPLNLINMNEEIKETVQDLIDRLLYLPEEDRSNFMSGLNTLFSKYETNMEVINGVRIYKINKR